MAIVTRYPSAFTTSANSTWVDGSNIFANDGLYATTAGYRNQNWDIIGSGFGFDIPAGSTINYVSVGVGYKLSTAASAWTGTLQAQYNGTIKGTAVTITTEPTTDTGLSSVNTGTWTIEELNSDLLQVLFRVRRSSNTACTYSVDYLSVTVDYTPSSKSLTIDYKYSDGTTAATSHSSQVNIGDSYNITSPTVSGYTPDQLSVSGTMGDTDVTVTVTYYKNNSLTIYYKKTDESTAATTHSSTVIEGQTYNVTSPAVSGYVAGQLSVSGTAAKSDITVTVYYYRIGTLTIYYQYADTSTAYTTYSANVTEGNTYSVDSPAIAGFHPDTHTVSGTMGTSDVSETVTYVGEVTITVNWLHQIDNTIVVAEVYAGLHLEGSVAEIEVPAVQGYTPLGTSPYVINPVPAVDTEYDYLYSMDAPVITVSVDRNRIGVNGLATATVTTDVWCSKFEARATLSDAPTGRGIGINVVADDETTDEIGVHTFPTRTNSWSFDVEQSELIADGDYIITVYAMNIEGDWGLGDLSDLTATAGDILYGKTAFTDTGKITGEGAYWQHAQQLNGSFYAATSLPETVSFYAPNATIAFQTFRNATGMKNLSLLMSNATTSVQEFAAFNQDIETLTINFSTANITSCRYLVYGASKLHTIYGALNLSSCTDALAAFLAVGLLVNIEFVPSTVKTSVSFLNSPLLSTTSLLSIVNGLMATNPSTLTMSATSKTNMNNILVDNESGIAIIGNAMTLTAFLTNIKGWTLV